MTSRFLWREVGLVLLSSLVLALTLLASFAIGLDRSLAQWQEEHGVTFYEFLQTELAAVYEREGVKDGTVIGPYLLPYLDPTLYLLVFDGQSEPVFWYWKGEWWYPGAGDGAAALDGLVRTVDDARLNPFVDEPARATAGSLMRHLRATGALDAVQVDGRVVGYFTAGSGGFTIDSANRRLITALLVGLAVGFPVAIAAGIGVTLVVSRSVYRGVSRITDALERIASGSRSEQLPRPNVTELRQIAASAMSLQDQLRREESLRRQWALDVAHDLRTPLAGLRGQIEGMRSGVLAVDERRYSILLGELGRLERLASDLLLLTRVESPELSLTTSCVSLAWIADTLRARFADHPALEITHEPTSVECDGDLVVRALSNLLDNAFRHGSPPVRCELGARLLRVTNSGSLPDGEAERLFDRARARETGHDGNGLGLPIVRAIAHSHGWEVSIAACDGVVSAEIAIPSHNLHITGAQSSADPSTLSL